MVKLNVNLLLAAWLALVAGSAWILLFPHVCVTTGEPKCRNTYLSENAIGLSVFTPHFSENDLQEGPQEAEEAFETTPLGNTTHSVFFSDYGGAGNQEAVLLVVPEKAGLLPLVRAVARCVGRQPLKARNLILLVLRPNAGKDAGRLAEYWLTRHSFGLVRQCLVFEHSAAARVVGADGNGISGNMDLYSIVERALPIRHSPQGLFPALWGLFEGSAGLHAVFLRRKIDALTLQFPVPGDAVSMGRAIELVLHSLNNLEEALHHSEDLYFLVDADKFVSIGEFAAPFCLVAVLPFALQMMQLWRDHRPSHDFGRDGAAAALLLLGSVGTGLLPPAAGQLVTAGLFAALLRLGHRRWAVQAGCCIVLTAVQIGALLLCPGAMLVAGGAAAAALLWGWTLSPLGFAISGLVPAVLYGAAAVWAAAAYGERWADSLQLPLVRCIYAPLTLLLALSRCATGERDKLQ